MKKMLLLLVTVCCLSPAAVFAAQQHPLVTDMAKTVAPSKFEAETALEYFTDKNHGAKATEVVVLETVTAGIAPKIDAFVSVPLKNIKEDDRSREIGFGDVTIGAKWNFSRVGKTALAIKPFLVLPTGNDNKGFGNGDVGFGTVAVASLELDKRTAIDANMSLKYQGVDVGDNYDEFGLSVAGKFEATKELKVVSELATAKNDRDGAKWETTFTAGVILEVKKNFDIDLGLRFGLTDNTSAIKDFGALAGVTCKF